MSDDRCPCGGSYAVPIRGTNTGLWLRTCLECFETVPADRPTAIVPARPTPVIADPMTSTGRLVRRPLDDLIEDVKRRQGNDND